MTNAKKEKNKNWSGYVTKHSFAFQLEGGVFTPLEIQQSSFCQKLIRRSRLSAYSVLKTKFNLKFLTGFTWDNPQKIAQSLKRSADASLRRKGTAYQSAMSMLNFYINRAGKNLKPERKKILERSKMELRKLFKVKNSYEKSRINFANTKTRDSRQER